jgi:hypothetical protein
MRHLLFFLVLFPFLLGCEEEKPCLGFLFGEPLEIGFGETIVHCSEDVSISFVDLLSDSRCPMNVVCIWEGMVEIKVSMTIRGNQSVFSLSSSPGFGEKIPNSRLIDGYFVKLENVLPYPVAGSNVKDKDRVVVLSVKKQ